MESKQLSIYDTLKTSNGYTCVCCGQFVKQYRRKINSSMAMVLILLYNHKKFDWLHVENFLKEIGKPQFRADFHKLRYWRLLEKKVADREDGSSRNGFYKLTSFGIMFIEKKIKVQEAVLIFNDKFEGFDGKEIDIKEALGVKFSYEELMLDI